MYETMYETIAKQCGNVNGASQDDVNEIRRIVCRMIRDEYAKNRRRAIPADTAWKNAVDDVQKMVHLAAYGGDWDAGFQLSAIAVDGILP